MINTPSVHTDPPEDLKLLNKETGDKQHFDERNDPNKAIDIMYYRIISICAMLWLASLCLRGGA